MKQKKQKNNKKESLLSTSKVVSKLKSKRRDKNAELAEGLFIEVFGKRNRSVCSKPAIKRLGPVKKNFVDTSQGFAPPTYVSPQAPSFVPQSKLGVDLLTSLQMAHEEHEEKKKTEKIEKFQERFHQKKHVGNRFGTLQDDSDSEDTTKTLSYFAPSTLILSTKRISPLFTIHNAAPVVTIETVPIIATTENGFAKPTFNF